MLHISRKISESVVIGNRVIVTLLDIKGRTAKLGFDSPQDIQIFRQELYERIKAENQENNQKILRTRKKREESIQ